MSTTARRPGPPAGAPTAPSRVDPRGQRFSAALTAALLVVALAASPSTLTTVLVGLQLLVFAAGSLLGPARTPYSLVFRTLVRPRLGAPRELEDAAPPRFAQTVGLGFAAVSLVGYLAGATAVGAVAAGFALAAAFLNAAFGFCLGCELYLIGKRATAR